MHIVFQGLIFFSDVFWLNIFRIRDQIRQAAHLLQK